MTRTPGNKRSAGMTLVELMIAIALGLLLVAVVIQIYIGSHASYIKQEDLSRLQENGREALSILGRNLRMAGYTSTPMPGNAGTVFVSPTLAIQGVDNGASPDTLTVRYQGSGAGTSSAGTNTGADNNTRDCLGQAIDSNHYAYNNFYIATGTGARLALFCDNTDDSTLNGTELISNVNFMKVVYGVSVSGNGNVDYYVPGALVPSFDKVVSVRVGLVAETPNPINNTEAVYRTFDVLGTTYTPPSDNRSRRLFTYVVALRNRTP